MIQLEKILQEHLAGGLKALYQHEVASESIGLQPTRKEFEGNFTFTTFPFTKPLRLSPEQLGEQLGTYLVQHSGIVARFNVVKGFLNLLISDAAWLAIFNETIQQPSFGTLPKRNQKVMVEYSSPNTNKPLHLGHLRNNFLGFSVSEILKASGLDVVKVNLVNDRGIHICKSMLAYLKNGHGETPASSGMKGDHLVGKYYVEFDKMLKAEMKSIKQDMMEGKLDLFAEAERSKIKGAQAAINTLEAKMIVSDAVVTDSNLEIAALLSAAAKKERSWKSTFKVLEDLLDDPKKLKDYKTKFKVQLEAEEKISDAQEEIDDLIKTKTKVLQEAQELLLKWEQGDKATVDLWKTMNGWVYEGFDATYKMIGVDFDKFYYESNTYLLGKEIVEEGLSKGKFFKKDDGSVWIDLTEDSLDQKLLLRGDGTSVYITQDLGTAELKYKEYGCDHSIYVVGNEQDYHFKVLQLILQKMEKPYAPGIFHLSYGMVDLPSGKMKSREGTVVDADDLVQELLEAAKLRTIEKGKIEDFEGEEAEQLYRKLAMGGLKYFLLKVDPKKRMLFNPEESIDEKGDTGPFIQYTYARTASLGRRAALTNVASDYYAYKNLDPSELEVIVHLSRFEEVILEAAKSYSPALIAQFAYELAKLFNRFFTEVSVFNDETPGATNFRVALSAATGKTIKKAMALLGIEVPERM